MFAEERPALLPLPVEPFRYYQYGERTVHLDGCVEVEAAYYSAPPGWIGWRVQVQWDGRHVRLLDPQTGQLLREHLRQRAAAIAFRTKTGPKKRRSGRSNFSAAPTRPERRSECCAAECTRRAWTDCGAQIQGVLSLTKKYGAATVEDACAAALEVGVCEYRFVRRYLERTPHCR